MLDNIIYEMNKSQAVLLWCTFLGVAILLGLELSDRWNAARVRADLRSSGEDVARQNAASQQAKSDAQAAAENERQRAAQLISGAVSCLGGSDALIDEPGPTQRATIWVELTNRADKMIVHAIGAWEARSATEKIRTAVLNSQYGIASGETMRVNATSMSVDDGIAAIYVECRITYLRFSDGTELKVPE